MALSHNCHSLVHYDNVEKQKFLFKYKPIMVAIVQRLGLCFVEAIMRVRFSLATPFEN